MNEHTNPDSLADPEFQAVLMACIEQLERGQTLDRQALLRKHPQFAQPLVEFLDNQMLLKKVAVGFRHRSTAVWDRSGHHFNTTVNHRD